MQSRAALTASGPPDVSANRAKTAAAPIASWASATKQQRPVPGSRSLTSPHVGSNVVCTLRESRPGLRGRRQPSTVTT